MSSRLRRTIALLTFAALSSPLAAGCDDPLVAKEDDVGGRKKKKKKKKKRKREDDEGDDEPERTNGAPRAATAPVPIGACQATNEAIGSYRPSTTDLTRAAAAFPEDGCMTKVQMAAALSQCSARIQAPLLSVDVPNPDYTACTVSTSTLEYGPRKLLKLVVFQGVGAKFFATEAIFDMASGKPFPYYAGDPASSQLCGGGGRDQTSAQMEADWKSIPLASRTAFFCGGRTPAGDRPPPPPPAPPSVDPGQAQALAFFQEVTRACSRAAPRAQGARVTESRPRSIYVVFDGAGKKMLVHLSARLVYGPWGPQGVMPRPYLHCRHDVFVGTMDH